ncbi:MAG: polyprenyl diphosphate synthase [Dehalococcoidia bacterium]|nr:polyprenyl diphosphate synthase [Dehalococcoidia bacterium]
MADSRLQIANLPKHVAIIMDGNGRWAQHRGLPRLAGHRAGTENVRPVIEAFSDEGIPYLTLYAFSTENWGRPRPEVNGLLEILAEMIEKETESLHRKGVRLLHLGRMEGLSPELQDAMRRAVERTHENTRINVCVAFNYGGRAEILDAVRCLLEEKVDPSQLDEDLFNRHLYTACMPDPDLIIRTAGEMRLSNFLIWQAAYAEYYSTPVYWPDFGREDVQQALLAYSQRQRRFGGL